MNDSPKSRSIVKVALIALLAVFALAVIGGGLTLLLSPETLTSLMNPAPDRWPYNPMYGEYYRVDQHGEMKRRDYRYGVSPDAIPGEVDHVLALHPDCPLEIARERLAETKPTVLNWLHTERTSAGSLRDLKAVLSSPEASSIYKLEFLLEDEEQLRSGEFPVLPSITHLALSTSVSIEFFADLPRVFPKLKKLCLRTPIFFQPENRTRMSMSQAIPLCVEALSMCKNLKTLELQKVESASELRDAMKATAPNGRVEIYGG